MSMVLETIAKHNRKGEKTRAGINWVEHYWFGPCKIITGKAAFEYHDKNRGMGSYYTHANYDRMRARVGDQLPGVIDALEKQYDGDASKLGLHRTIGRLLVHRGGFCLPKSMDKNGKDELLRFQQPDFAATYAPVYNGDRLSSDDLLDIQTRRILLECPGVGLYLRWNPNEQDLIYVGIANNQAARDKGHGNSPLKLWTVYSTTNRELAARVERKTHEFLREIGAPASKGTRGLFRVHRGNALQLVQAFMNKWYADLFHNIGGCKL